MSVGSEPDRTGCEVELGPTPRRTGETAMIEHETQGKTIAIRMIDRKELAGMLGISVRHLARLVRDGEVPAPRRLGRCVRFLLDDIERWLAETAQGPGADGEAV